MRSVIVVAKGTRHHARNRRSLRWYYDHLKNNKQLVTWPLWTNNDSESMEFPEPVIELAIEPGRDRFNQDLMLKCPSWRRKYPPVCVNKPWKLVILLIAGMVNCNWISWLIVCAVNFNVSNSWCTIAAYRSLYTNSASVDIKLSIGEVIMVMLAIEFSPTKKVLASNEDHRRWCCASWNIFHQLKAWAWRDALNAGPRLILTERLEALSCMMVRCTNDVSFFLKPAFKIRVIGLEAKLKDRCRYSWTNGWHSVPWRSFGDVIHVSARRGMIEGQESVVLFLLRRNFLCQK